MAIEKVSPLRDFVYGEDRLVVADMAYRDKSYIVMMQKKLNELARALDEVVEHQRNQDKEFEKRVTKAEQAAAEKIYKASKKGEDGK